MRVLGPQSNQRGIETEQRHHNRNQPGRPQSNQRGIETIVNATPVFAFGWPQSNQRGIETALWGGSESIYCWASIEPAWD
mgnify:CR=1 FL=1